jgi:hypothetical protein
MAVSSLSDERIIVDTDNDSIVIVHYIEGVPGGRSLDTTDFEPKVIKTGHIIIKDEAGNHKPMPVSGDNYAALPAAHTYVGTVASSVLTSKARVGIMVRGSVNQVASPYPVTDSIKTGLPHIRFTQD